MESVAFSADGSTVFSWSSDVSSWNSDATLKHWDLATGKEIRSTSFPFRGYNFPLFLGTGIQLYTPFSSDMMRAAINGKTGLEIWDTLAGQMVQTLIPSPAQGHMSSLPAVFSTDSAKVVVESPVGTCRIWDLVTGEQQTSFRFRDGDQQGMASLAVGPDASRVSVSYGFPESNAQVYDALSGERLYSLEVSDFWSPKIKFSPDGMRVAAASSVDGLIKIWDAASGKHLFSLRGHEKGVYSLAFSPDGTILASGGAGGGIELWDTASGHALRALKGHMSGVTSLSFSPDGTKLASGGRDFTVKLWDLTVNEQPGTLRWDADESITSVATSPDGSTIICGTNEGRIVVLDSSNAKELTRFKAHEERVTGVSLSPDGKQVVSCGLDPVLRIWDPLTGMEMRVLEGCSTGAKSVSWSPTGVEIVSGSVDKKIRIWNSVTGNELFTLSGHQGEVTSVALSPDGMQIVSGSGDDSAKIWNAHTGQLLTTLFGHVGSVMDTVFSPDGGRIASVGDPTIRLWKSQTGQPLLTIPMYGEQSGDILFNQDGTRLFAAADLNTKIWDAETGEELLALNHGRDALAIDGSFRGDQGRIVSGGLKSLQVVNADSTVELRTLQGHTTDVSRFAFSNDGTQVVAGSGDGSIKVWKSTHDLPRIAIAGVPGKGIENVTFCAEGNRVISKTLYAGYEWHLWDVATGKAMYTIDDSRDVSSVAFSPDKSRFVEGNDDGTLELFDGVDGSLLRTFQSQKYGCLTVAYCPDGSKLVSAGDDGLVKLWDVATGHELHTFSGHTDTVLCVVFNPSGEWIASASSDNTIKVWDVVTGQELWTLSGHTDDVDCVAFDHSGNRIVSAGWDDTLRVWEAATGVELRTIKFDDAESIDCIAFSPSGDQIIAVTHHDSLHLIDAATGQELRTLDDLGQVNCIALSPDGNRMYLPHEFGGDMLLETQAVQRLLAENWASPTANKTRSDDGRWLLSSSGNTVLVVDLHYQLQPFEQAIRASKVKPRPPWHQERAASAPNLYTKLFHLAWLMKYAPEDPQSYDQLHDAYAQWLAEWNAQQEQHSEFSSGDNHNEELAKPDPNQLLPPIVRSMLALPRGNAKPEPAASASPGDI